MKRLLFVVLALSCFVGAASAQTTRIAAPEWSYGNLINFRTTIQGNVTAGTISDTSWATGAAARTDTSAAFPLFEVFYPKATVVSDTTLINIVLHFDPISTSGITTLAESTIFVLPQTSDDGTTWQSATTHQGNAGSAFNVTGSNHLGIVIAPVSSSTYICAIPQKYDTFMNPTMALVSTAPTWKTLAGHRYVRFLVGSATTGKYALTMDYLKFKD